MMPTDAGTALVAGGMVVGAIVWLIRLEGRINLSDSRYADLRAALDEIRLDLKELLRK